MGDALNMAKVSARGGFNLFWGLITSSLISAVGVIIVARLLSPSEYGLVTIALMAPAIIALFRGWGVNSAIIKYVAQYRSEDKTSRVKSIIASGTLFELALGIALSTLSFSLSGFMATSIFHRPEIKPLIEVASLIVMANAIITAAQSTFTGFEEMQYSSITMVAQSTLKTILAPTLILIGYGALGVILGSVVALTAAGALAIMIAYKKFYKKLNNSELQLKEDVKAMLKYGLPLSASAILGGVVTQIYNFLIAIYCTNAIVGNYQVALNFAVLITFFATPITTVHFPAFSKINLEKDVERLSNVFQLSVKYASLLVVPVAAATIALSKPLIYTLFGEKYAYAPLFLTLIAATYLYTAFGSLSLGNLLNGQGETKTTMKLALITIALGLPLSLTLIPKLGVIGLLITNLAAGVPSLTIGLSWVKKHFKATIDLKSSTKILLASTVAAATTYAITSQLTLSSWIELIIGAAAFLTIYITAAPLVGAISRTDIQNIKEMLKELKPLTSLFNPLLNIAEKLIIIYKKA